MKPKHHRQARNSEDEKPTVLSLLPLVLLFALFLVFIIDYSDKDEKRMMEKRKLTDKLCYSLNASPYQYRSMADCFRVSDNEEIILYRLENVSNSFYLKRLHQ